MKKINERSIKPSFVFVLVIFITKISLAQTYQVDQENAIKQRIDQFVDDVNNSNAEGFVDAFSDKLYSRESKQGIKQTISQRGAYYDIEYSIHIKEVRVDKKLAYEEGWYRNVLTPKNGGDKIIEQYDFLDVWELEADGKWRIIKALKVERPLNEYKLSTDLDGEMAIIAGSYKTEQLEVEIKINLNNQPVLIVSGGNPIILEKNAALTYELKGVPGALLRFEVGNEMKAAKAILTQASGEIVAKRIQ